MPSQYTVICPVCGREIKSLGIFSHTRSHQKIKRSTPAWNKGLTKETSSSVRKYSEKLKESGKRNYSYLKKWLTDNPDQFLESSSKGGGVRIGAGRGKKGRYKGYWCDSSWELAWVIYNIDHNIKFERNTRGFKYEYEGKTVKYYPDFKMEDGSFVEIKNYPSSRTEAKIAGFSERLKVLYEKDLKEIFEYVLIKYGKDYTQLYE